MYAPQHSTGVALMDHKRIEAHRIGPSGPPNGLRHRHRRPRTGVFRARIALLLLAGVVAAACSTGVDFERVHGSGRIATEKRTVAGFDHISVAGGAEVVVKVTGTESLVVEAEDNLLEVLTVEVVDGELRLGVASHVNIEPTRPIVYQISAAKLDGVAISGSALIEAFSINTDRFDVSIAGSGRVVPFGTVTDLDVTIGGSGRFEGRDLLAQHGSVNVSGSGQALVNVSDDLDASVSGSGHIGYRGEPTIRSSLSGSGSIGRSKEGAENATVGP